jgi:hypothetical protein
VRCIKEHLHPCTKLLEQSKEVLAVFCGSIGMLGMQQKLHGKAGKCSCALCNKAAAATLDSQGMLI